MKKDKNIGNMSRIKVELERRLIVMRYSKTSITHNMRIFGWVDEYLKGYSQSDYTKEWGQKFLAEYMLHDNYAPSMFRTARTLIRRLDEIQENKLFSPCFREAGWKCPARFTEWWEKYLQSLAKRGFRETTIQGRRMYSGKLLSRLPETVLTLESLTAADLYRVFTQYEWPTTSYYAASSLLSFLHENRVTKENLSACVPKPTRPRALPSIYSGEEIERLLSSVDRDSNMGKRDYAILMIASHMGLRSSDIVNLSLTDINYIEKTVEITQIKTQRPVTLVMNGEVEETITDYIENGRPRSESDKIFLSTQAPYTPLTAASGHAIANKYFIRAGIAAQGRERGIHALRASYATALVSQGIPYVVVQEALGHEDPESAKYYVRVDIKRLRTCALDVPKPIGAFAVMLGDLEGVL